LGNLQPSDGVTWRNPEASAPEQTVLRPGAVNGRAGGLRGRARNSQGERRRPTRGATGSRERSTAMWGTWGQGCLILSATLPGMAACMVCFAYPRGLRRVSFSSGSSPGGARGCRAGKKKSKSHALDLDMPSTLDVQLLWLPHSRLSFQQAQARDAAPCLCKSRKPTQHVEPMWQRASYQIPALPRENLPTLFLALG
jgi:hypothetical protein